VQSGGNKTRILAPDSPMDFQAASQAGWSAGGNAVRAGALRFRCPVEGCGTVGYPDPETLL